MDHRPAPRVPNDKSVASVEQLITDLETLLDDQDHADIVFLLGREEERFYAHRLILMVRCKCFKTTKRGEICRIAGGSVIPETSGALTMIRLPYINPEIFRQFLRYVYTGKIVIHDSKVFEIMMLAHDMGLGELRNDCEEHVVSALTAENACTLLTTLMKMPEKIGKKSWSEMKDIEEKLQRIILFFIGENAQDCVKAKSFLNLTKEALIKLISSDYFCLEEEEVWRCVLLWAKHHAGVTQATTLWSEDERVRVCQYLSGVINHVRLLLIDSKVFAEEVEPTGAVPIELSLERYRYAALQTNQNSSSFPTVPQSNPKNSKKVDVDKRLQPRFIMNLFPSSIILKNDKMHFQSVLNGWFGSPKQTWRLLYRASTNGSSSAAFHRHCDGISPLFVIALGSRGEISGGFTDVPWTKTNKKGGYIHSERAFLFSLTSESPTKYDIIKKPYAICYHAE
ncbi:hypothetical protein ACFFRR_010083 [Megaselia abdita]